MRGSRKRRKRWSAPSPVLRPLLRGPLRRQQLRLLRFLVLLQGVEELHRPLLRHAGLLPEALVLALFGALRTLVLLLVALVLFFLVPLLLVLLVLLLVLLLVFLVLLVLVVLLLLLLLLFLLLQGAERQLEAAAAVQIIRSEAQRVAVGLDCPAGVLLLEKRGAQIEGRRSGPGGGPAFAQRTEKR